jgi:hypothetical protein
VLTRIRLAGIITDMKNEARFIELQVKAREAAAKRDAFRRDLDFKYGRMIYAKIGERKQLDKLDAAEKRAFDRFYAHLTKIAGRDFGTGFPTYWLRDCLIYADAITRGQMSTVPPAAWGYTDHAMRQFAEPVRGN